jgi:ribosomal protein S18 acetylase RimI-like enzyme
LELRVDLGSVQEYLRATLREGRDCEQIGPILASFDPANANPYLNYAIPDNGARPSQADVAMLIEAYERRSRKPRLEYVAELAPAVEPILMAAGFRVEGRLALMELAADAQQPPTPELVGILRPTTDDELLAVLSVEHEAYGDPNPPSDDEVAALRRRLAERSGAILARTATDHTAVGAGEYSRIIGGATEINSIGVRPAYRRRGIAAAVTAALARSARSAGATTLFLMADEAEERIYARVGFVTEARILHISR